MKHWLESLVDDAEAAIEKLRKAMQSDIDVINQQPPGVRQNRVFEIRLITEGTLPGRLGFFVGVTDSKRRELHVSSVVIDIAEEVLYLRGQWTEYAKIEVEKDNDEYSFCIDDESYGPEEVSQDFLTPMIFEPWPKGGTKIETGEGDTMESPSGAVN